MPSITRRKLLQGLAPTVTLGLASCMGISANADAGAEETAGSQGSSESSGSSQSQESSVSQAAVEPASNSFSLPSAVSRGDLPEGVVPLIADGKVTFLNYFATWCKPCQDEMPALRRLRSEFDRSELHMVSISSEERHLLMDFWSDYDGTWPVVMDTNLRAMNRWDVNYYPTNMLFDPTGQPIHGNSPKIRAQSFDTFASKVRSLLAEDT